MKILKLSLVLAFVALASTKELGDDRQKRLLSLFNIVVFKHETCTPASDSSTHGTCMKVSDCENAGGAADGRCAAGFGMCCVFTHTECGGNIGQNCTYIQNPEYPAATTSAETCRYTFNRICDNLCQIRLDFLTLQMADPPTVGDDVHGLCSDSGDTFSVTSPTGRNPPTICGTNSGQHMYFETGNTGDAGMANLVFGATAVNGKARIKVTYYTCDSPAKAPEDCTQYFTGIMNSFQSYNYNRAQGQLLQSQNYATCIRQEEGFCAIEYAETGTQTAGMSSFQLFEDVNDNPGTTTTMVGAACKTYVGITSAFGANMICGMFFGPVTAGVMPIPVRSSVTPFRVDTIFPEMLGMTGSDGPNIGYDLTYRQIPCGNDIGTAAI